MEKVPEGKKHGVGFGIILNRDNKILLGQRHADPGKADSELRGEGTWTLPGGKLIWGESFEEAAVREVKEETGIDLHSMEVVCINNDMNEFAHFVTIGMYSKDFIGDPQVLEPDEITKWEWFDINDLPTPLFFPSERLIDNYIKGEFYIPR